MVIPEIIWIIKGVDDNKAGEFFFKIVSIVKILNYSHIFFDFNGRILLKYTR